VFTVRTDGGATLETVTATAGSNSYAVEEVTCTAGAVTVEILRSSSSVWIMGIETYSSAEPRVTFVNSAWYGITSSILDDAVYPWDGAGCLAAVDPDLVIISMTTNDVNGSLNVDTYKTLIDGFVVAAQAAGADVLLMSDGPFSGATYANFNNYNEKLREIAVARGCMWLDMDRVWVSYSSANTNGLMSDTLHENASGAADKATAIVSRIASAGVANLPSQTTPLATYAAGTAYSLTASDAAVDFGTTDPTITIATAGTYLIQGRANLKYNGATYAGTQTATVHLRRTNNTPADISNATTTATMRIVTTITDTVGVMPLPPVIYTATAGDVISVYGSLSAAPAAGSVDCTEASIVAIRIS
jgi:hypothetical protein